MTEMQIQKTARNRRRLPSLRQTKGRKIPKQRKRSSSGRKIRRTKKTRRSMSLLIGLPVRWQSLITSASVQKRKNPRCMKSARRIS